MTKKKPSTSAEWNRANPERVLASQKRYSIRELKRRRSLTPYKRAKEDIGKVIKNSELTPREWSWLFEWIAEQIERKI